MKANVRVLDPSPAPGSPEWRKLMTASKIAAVVGKAPPKWATRFTLWHEMAGISPPQPQNADQSRGHYLEPAVAAWLADEIAELGWTFQDNPRMTLRDDWMGATPDGFITTTEKDAFGIFRRILVEIKTSLPLDGWGKSGTTEIPEYYVPQIQWSMHVHGLDECIVAAFLGDFSFRKYAIKYDPAHAARLEEAARAFMDTLPGGPNECRPGIDDALSTYECVRRIHPEIDPEASQEIPWPMVTEYLTTHTAAKEAEAAHRKAKTQVLDVMGKSKFGTVGPENVFRRQPSGKTVALYTVKPPKAA